MLVGPGCSRGIKVLLVCIIISDTIILICMSSIFRGFFQNDIISHLVATFTKKIKTDIFYVYKQTLCAQREYFGATLIYTFVVDSW